MLLRPKGCHMQAGNQAQFHTTYISKTILKFRPLCDIGDLVLSNDTSKLSLYLSLQFRPTLLVLHQLDIEWYAFLVPNELDLEILEIVIFLMFFWQTLLQSYQCHIPIGELFELIPHVVLFRDSLVNPGEVMFLFLLQGHELGCEAFYIGQSAHIFWFTYCCHIFYEKVGEAVPQEKRMKKQSLFRFNPSRL